MRITKNLVLLGILLLSLLLALYRIQDCRLWIDEFFSINIAQRSLSDIWSMAPHPIKFYYNKMPPLYETILHFIWDPKGTNILAPRLLSIFFHLASIYLIFKLTKLLFDVKTGVLAAFLASLNIAYLVYSKMIRCYALLNAFSLLSLYLFFLMIKKNSFQKRYLLALLLVNTCLLYTFYFGVFVILMEILFAFFIFRKRISPKIVFPLILPFYFFLPWLKHFIYDVVNENALQNVLLYPNIFQIIFSRFSSNIFHSTPLALLYIFVFLFVSLKGLFLFLKGREVGAWLTPLALFLLIPSFSATFLTRAMTDLTRARYSFIFIFPFFILTSYAIVNASRFFRVSLFSVFCIFSIGSLNAYLNAPIHEFWPARIALLAEEAKKIPIPENDKVIIEVEHDFFIPLFIYYFYGPDYFRDVSYPTLWSGYKKINLIDPQYKIYYNIAPKKMRQYLSSAPAFLNADWLFLFYSNWFSNFWVKPFRQAYEDKLKSFGIENRILLVEKKICSDFTLEIYKVKK